MFRTLRRTVHTNAKEEWTKASLRRMKKPELTQLAREHNLKLSGTKNDIIIQLLTHQTAKIVGVQTPASLSLPKTKELPAFGSLDKDSYTDLDWANAFEMKLTHRPTSKGSNKDNSNTSKPHHYNQQIKPNLLLQAENLFIVPEKPVSTPIEITKDLEGMDPQWVEAFDMKVGSRGGRHALTDTLSATTTSTPALEELEFITIDKGLGKKFDHVKKHTEKHGKVHYHNEQKHAIHRSEKLAEKAVEDSTEMKSGEKSGEESNKKSGEKSTKSTEKSAEKTTEKSTEKTTKSEIAPVEKSVDGSDTKTDGNQGSLLGSAIGSSMLLWYIGGEEGLLKIWHYFG